MTPKANPADAGPTDSAAHPLAIASIDLDDDDRLNTRNGVFYPTGFALLAFAARARIDQAIEALRSVATEADALTVLSAGQMHAIAQRSQDNAGVLSRIVSAELKQLTVFEQLASANHEFLLVRDSEDVRPVLERVGVDAVASKAVLFRTLAIEELPVPKETIPGTSPFGVNEVIRSQETDADLDR